MDARRLAPEAFAWAVGVVFRLGLFRGFNPRMGYDTNAHTGYMAYLAEHGAIPPIDLVWTANHPPLYYALCAGLHHLGAWPHFEVGRLQVLSVAFAIARLTVLWWGLRQVLPSGVGRTAALLLAAVLPCAVHGDGMITNETLNGLVGTLVITIAFKTFAGLQSDDRPRWRWSLALGVTLLLALLTKISGLLVAAAVAMGLGLSLVRVERPAQWLVHLPARLKRRLPIALALVVAVGVSLPVYGRHREATGLWLPTSFERNAEARAQQAKLRPYFERRPASYYFGTALTAMFETPYYPTAVDRFWMVVLASTFTDYYNYSFVEPPPSVPQRRVNYRPLALTTMTRMRLALASGLVLGLALIGAYLVIVARALRRWDVAQLVALSVPAAGVLGQLHYATKYPFDYMGLVKGLYLQFGWAPLFACFGALVAWAWSTPVERGLGLRTMGRAVVAVLAIALIGVAQYSVHGVFEW